MSHIDDDLLASFVDGDVGEHTAVQIATHLDDCPLCAARAATLEPLAGVFAHAADPEVPMDLVAAVLAEAARPDPVAPVGREVVVGAAMLAAGLGLAVLYGEHMSWVSRIGVLLEASGAAAHAVQVALPSSALAFLLALAGGTAAAIVARPELWFGSPAAGSLRRVR
ncbi:MAG: hypothetical protein H6734_01190 [Alphaproteobacteria bacterium]|nr:hypothetical protein [Alphaproteobacteria bacterium]